jgi:hypothetical protein
VSAEGWNPALISSEALFGGSAVRLRFHDGVTVVAQPGTRVVFGSRTTLVGQKGGGKPMKIVNRSVRLLTPRRGAPTAADAQRYAASGRSVYADAVAAGFSPAAALRISQQNDAAAVGDEPPVIDSGCVYSEDAQPDPDFEWSGCYKGYEVHDEDPNNFYPTYSSKASGWGTGVLGGGKELDGGGTDLFFYDTEGQPLDGEIVDWSPDASLPGQNCAQVNITLGYHDIGIEYAVPLCNDGWDVTRERTWHLNEWHGASAGGPGDTRAAANAVVFRTPLDGRWPAFGYGINWGYTCFC